MHLRPHGCAAVVGRLLGSPGGAHLRRLANARIVGVDVQGGVAEVRIAGLDRPTDVVLDGGAWRISSKPSGEGD